MKPNPSAPAATLMKHLKSSQNRIERMARDAEYFRTGLRQIESDAMTLRNVLEDKPDELAAFERSYMAMKYVAGGILVEFDRLVKMELELQREVQRWLQGRTPAVDGRRPHVAYQQGERGQPVPPPRRNGPMPAAGPGTLNVPTKVRAVAPNQKTVQVKGEDGAVGEIRGGPDPAVAVGYFRDDKTGQVVWINAYDQVVDPPDNAEEIIAVPLDGLRGSEAVPPDGAPPVDGPETDGPETEGPAPAEANGVGPQ